MPYNVHVMYVGLADADNRDLFTCTLYMHFVHALCTCTEHVWLLVCACGGDLMFSSRHMHGTCKYYRWSQL